MSKPTHVIDPDGEVIIVLRNANTPFAMPDKSILTGDFVSYALRLSGGYAGAYANETAMYEAMLAQECLIEPVEAPVEAPTEEPAEEPTEEFAAEMPEDPVTGPEFRIQVSAKHLILASPVFKGILTGGWKESVTYLQKGSVEITAQGWELEALLIVLRIIHCQHCPFPRQLSLEMLAKVAVVADYYECQEAVVIFADIWINGLEEKIPETYCRDLILWGWVAWFFRLPAQFKKVTSVAMSGANAQITSLGLPIPVNVMGKPHITEYSLVPGN